MSYLGQIVSLFINLLGIYSLDKTTFEQTFRLDILTAPMNLILQEVAQVKVTAYSLSKGIRYCNPLLQNNSIIAFVLSQAICSDANIVSAQLWQCFLSQYRLEALLRVYINLSSFDFWHEKKYQTSASCIRVEMRVFVYKKNC